MDIRESFSGSVLSARCDGEMTIYAAGDLKPRMLGWLARSTEVEIDLQGVSEIDTAGVQLLLLLKCEAVRRGAKLRLIGHSRAVREVIDLYWLAGEFGDPILIPSEGSA